jgi:hypothetical protein
MKRVIKETNWTVSLVSTQGQAISKVVSAPTQDVAVRRAQQAFKGQDFTNVTVTPADTGQPAPSQQPPSAALPRQLTGLKQLQPLFQLNQQLPQAQQAQQAQPQQPMESIVIRTEAITYPYSITLPAQFRRVLRESSPVKVNEQFGQYSIILENKTEMREFLSRLNHHKDRDLIRIIADGIRSSIS